MAYRLHVIAAFGASPDEFRRVLAAAGSEDGESKPERFRFGATDRWQWANASVWSVNGNDIDQALAKLDAPSFRVTSSDGILWMFSLAAKQSVIFRGVHFFTQVGPPNDSEDETPPEAIPDEDFPDDELDEVAGINKFIPELQFLWDEAEEARLKQRYAAEQAMSHPVLDAFKDYGVVFPPNLAEQISQQPEGRAWRTALAAHAGQMIHALESVGIPVDAEALLQLLTVGPLTTTENESDLGNMPRFLATLGVEGVFESVPEDIKAEDEEDEPEDDTPDWAEYPPGELFESTDPIIAAAPLTPLIDAPFVTAPTQIALLHLLAHLCSEDDEPVHVSCRFPADNIALNGQWRYGLTGLEVRREENEWQICGLPQMWWYACEDQSSLDEHEFVDPLRTLPDGTRFTFTFLVDGPQEQCHRYAGIIRDDSFTIDQVYPPMSAATLSDALATMHLIIGPAPIELASADEEAVVRAAYEEDGDGPAKIRNRKIKLEYGERKNIVRALFFARFRNVGPWDIEGAEARIAEENEQLERWLGGTVDGDEDDEDLDDEDVTSEDNSTAKQQIAAFEQMMEQAEREKYVPHSDEVIYHGKSGPFYLASMSDLPHVPDDKLANDDAALAACGFAFVADMVAEIDRQELTRCYAGPAMAIAILGRRIAGNEFVWSHESDGSTLHDLSNGLREFHTHFEDGSTLVTNDNGGALSQPHRNIFVRTYDEFAPADLWTKHLDGIAKFEQHRHTKPIDHTPFRDPFRFAEVMDDLICRFTGKE